MSGGQSEFSGWRALLPRPLAERIDLTRVDIRRTLKCLSASLPPEACVLDAGAGDYCQASYFRGARYISMDYGGRGVFPIGPTLDVFGDVTAIPFNDDVFDLVISIEVLEHIPTPARALAELRRVARPGGLIFLTTPLKGPGFHDVPYDYFRYTPTSLRMMCDEAALEVRWIRPHGGYFWCLGMELVRLPGMIFPKPRGMLARLAYYGFKQPITLPLFEILVPLVCYYADRLDCEKLHTQGYMTLCRKPGPAFSTRTDGEHETCVVGA